MANWLLYGGIVVGLGVFGVLTGGLAIIIIVVIIGAMILASVAFYNRIVVGRWFPNLRKLPVPGFLLAEAPWLA